MASLKTRKKLRSIQCLLQFVGHSLASLKTRSNQKVISVFFSIDEAFNGITPHLKEVRGAQ